MATTTPDYTATATLTIAGASALTNGVTWVSTAVASNAYMDVHVWVKTKTDASCTVGAVNVLYLVSTDTLPGQGISSSASVANDFMRNQPLIGVFSQGTSATGSATTIAGPFSIAVAAGGTMPQTWMIGLSNQCGQTFDSTSSAVILYQGIKYTTA